MDLKERKVLPAKHQLPALLLQLAERMRVCIPALRTFHPTEANAIDYHKSAGHLLHAHVDDRQMSSGEIVTLSLQVRACLWKNLVHVGHRGGDRCGAVVRHALS